MGTAVSGDSELIRVTMLDFFSGQVLVDKLVYPDVPMLHFNTRFSGVRAGDINRARRAGTCYYGRSQARNAIFEYVGQDTVVVGHAASNDLKSLRWIHLKVLDTLILESAIAAQENALDTNLSSMTPDDVSSDRGIEPEKTKSKGSGRLSLKTLSKTKLNRDIQAGRNGHDSVEDALAARDLVHCHLLSEKQSLVTTYASLSAEGEVSSGA
jgi:RNA exonuclease 1